MIGYLEKIDLIRSVRDTLSGSGSAAEIILENEVETLKNDVENQKALLQYLDEQFESSGTDLDMQKEINRVQFANIREDLQSLNEKTNILTTYINVLNTEEFPINRLWKETDDYVKDFWARLKPFTEKAKLLKGEIAQLKELHEKYMDRKQKTDNSMT